MSAFGNPKEDYLLSEIQAFFNEGGTLEEFYKILHYFFEDYELKEKE